MTLLKNPSELFGEIVVKGLIYGQPGTGKSTVALSSPNPIVIDADLGLYRVEKRFQVPSLQLKDYADLLKLLQSDELDNFDTLIFDTVGKLTDRIMDFICRNDDKNRKRDGSPSMQGWGALKVEFLRLLKRIEAKNKHVIFIAHEKEKIDGDIRIVRPDISGSSGDELVKELDFMGYMDMRGCQRVISFSPTEKYYAKNSINLPSFLKIPDTNDNTNDFIKKNIIDRTVARLKSEEKEVAKYHDLVDRFKENINIIESSMQATALLNSLGETKEIWDSHKLIKRFLNAKITELKFTYNKDAKEFESTEKSPEPKNDNEEISEIEGEAS